MTAVEAPLLNAALTYAALGWPVVPLHTPVDGVCDCPKHDQCEAPGKHPRTLHGLDDAATDEGKIRRWWGIWPHANVAIDLARAGLLDVAPDSLEWYAEFLAAGLPPTLTFASGAGEGHQHWLYARPEGCPTYRLCETGQYDILSAGYAVMPPSLHASGRTYTWLEPPEGLPIAASNVAAPGWTVGRILERTAKKEHAASVDFSGDEPPVVLRGEALERWYGRVFEAKPDGTVDRSYSLWWLAVVLLEAGRAPGFAMYDLAGRDVDLGWTKFADRTDAMERYRVIVERALATRGSKPVRLPGFDSRFPPLKSREPGIESFELRLWPNLELATRVAQETAWWVLGLVGPGLMTELDGWAKLSGKTTLILAMIRALLRGEDFLGLATAPTGVVYLTEQTWQSLLPNIRKAGLADADHLYWAFYNEAYGAPWSEVIASAIAQALANRCGLLVVDTLAQWSGLKGDIENNSGTAYQILAALQPAIAAGLAVLILRHDKKAGGEVTLSARGSGAYAAVMDVVLHLAPVVGESASSRQRLLTGSGRFADETPPAIVIELSTAEPLQYTSLGDPDTVATVSGEAKVWGVLPAEERFAIDLTAVCEYAGVRREDVGKILHQMVLDTRVLRKGEGVKGKPWLFWRRTLEVGDD